MDELKNLFIYKTEEQHKQEFNQILQEIEQYDSELEYWSNIPIDKNRVSCPLYYETNKKLEIPEIKNGYLFLYLKLVLVIALRLSSNHL